MVYLTSVAADCLHSDIANCLNGIVESHAVRTQRVWRSGVAFTRPLARCLEVDDWDDFLDSYPEHTPSTEPALARGGRASQPPPSPPAPRKAEQTGGERVAKASSLGSSSTAGGPRREAR